MKQFNPEKDCVKPTSAVNHLDQHKEERQYPAYIGLDVHKNTIAWAVAREGRQEPEYRGEIANRERNVTKLVDGAGGVLTHKSAETTMLSSQVQ